MAPDALLAVDDVYVMDGSMRSARADAFVSGLGRTRKVVPFDTLIEKHGIEGTVAVVAHEVGHAVHRHVPTCLAGNLATIALTLSHPAPVDRIRAIDARS